MPVRVIHRRLDMQMIDEIPVIDLEHIQGRTRDHEPYNQNNNIARRPSCNLRRRKCRARSQHMFARARVLVGCSGVGWFFNYQFICITVVQPCSSWLRTMVMVEVRHRVAAWCSWVLLPLCGRWLPRIETFALAFVRTNKTSHVTLAGTRFEKPCPPWPGLDFANFRKCAIQLCCGGYSYAYALLGFDFWQ